MQRVVDVAKGTINGCAFAGAFILEGATISTPAYTDPVVVGIGAFHHETREGPCLVVISAVYADDLIDQGRWAGSAPGRGGRGP